MADYDQRLAQSLTRLENHHNDGRVLALRGGGIDPTDYELITEFLDAYNPEKHRAKPPGHDKTKSKGTIARWGRQLDLLCRYTHRPLHAHSAEDVNRLMDDLFDGTHPDAPDGGYAQSTVRQHQLTLRKFYRFHGDSTQAESIYTLPTPDTTVDKADMFTWDEIEAMWDAINNARDKAMFDLFLYTGQRLTAIQTLRIKDVNVDEGTFRLNPDEPGLKGAQGHRPLLGAQASTRDWLDKHPASDDPDSYLLTQLPSWGRGGDGEMLCEAAYRRVLRQIGDRAGVNKPVNPHAFRHNFVTIAHAKYDMDKDTIRHLIGHGENSRVMETTYKHLDDEDYIRDAEEAFGIRDANENSPLTPAMCPTCSEALSPDAKACPNCGAVFTPDAHSVREQIQEDVYSSAKVAKDEEVLEGLDELRGILRENPELLGKILDGDID